MPVGPLGLWVEQDGRPAVVCAGYGMRSMPTTLGEKLHTYRPSGAMLVHWCIG